MTEKSIMITTTTATTIMMHSVPRLSVKLLLLTKYYIYNTDLIYLHSWLHISRDLYLYY